jgi:nucleoid-associated protein YgaU
MGLFDFFNRSAEQLSDKQDSKSVSAAGPAPTRTYVIKSGDSLSKIAKQFYGRTSDWHKLHEANYDKIRNPSILHPGEEIVIP